MPWASTIRPSLAVGILRQLGRDAEVPAQVLYPNLDFAAKIGPEVAGGFAQERWVAGLSEHLFACDLFDPDLLRSEELLKDFDREDLPPPLNDLGYLRALRDEVIPAFLTEVTQRVTDSGAGVLGVSATFNQVMASLALCARVKAADPTMTTIAGGACFAGEMGLEYHRVLPEVLDHVFLGEAEESFPEFLHRRRDGRDTTGIPGVSWHDGVQVRHLPGRGVNMNAVPTPDFDDFFAEADRVHRATGYVFNIEYLPFESSRGCWWGARSHCVFCGLDDDLLSYREKDPDRVVAEIVALTSRYRALRLNASDPIISRKNRRRIWTGLKDLDLDVECFYETRADLSKDEFALMREAGIGAVQPGIESFSSELLQLMGKGTTRIRQVRYLRWAQEYGIRSLYNLLAGFPGEQASWYREMAQFLPRISHLRPPNTNITFVELHRYSPLFTRPDSFGVEGIRLRHDFAFNFPEGLADPLQIGYFYEYSSSRLADRADYEPQLHSVVQSWLDAHALNALTQKARAGLTASIAAQGNDAACDVSGLPPPPPMFEYRVGPGFTLIDDTRPHRDSRRLTLSGLHEDVLLLCDTIQTRTSLLRLLEPVRGGQAVHRPLAAAVEDLLAADLLMAERDQLLTLPIARRPRATSALQEYVIGRRREEA